MDARARRGWEILLKVDGWKSSYASVDQLLRHLARKTRSEGSRATYLKTLAQFVRFTGLSPDELMELGKEEVEEKVQSFCDLAKAPRTANRKMEELRTFFKGNGFRVGDTCNLVLEKRYVGTGQRSREEYIPTDEEIDGMVNRAGLNLKWRAIVLMIYTTGMRNSTDRAMRYGDIREELKVGVIPLLVRVYPEMKKVIPGACKNNIPYLIFMPKETVEAVKAYLDEREATLGFLDDEQILFCSDDNRIPKEKRPYTPLNMSSLEKYVRKAAKAAKIREWQNVTPQSIRKAFERAIRNSGLDPKDQEFFMGHILPGSQDFYYDKTKIEEMRRKYARIIFFPSRTDSLDVLRKKQVADIFKVLGFPEDKIKKVEEALAKYARARAHSLDETVEEIRKLRLEDHKLKGNPNGNPKKIIDEDQLEKYLAEGWEVQTVLPSGRILIHRLSA